MTRYIVEDVEGPPTSGYTVEDADGPPNKTNKSLSGALARGTENAASGLGALISETGKHIGGGKTFPKLMASLAKYLHDPNYQTGMDDAADPNASLMTRAGGVGRALVEGVPAMAASGVAGMAGGPMGFLAAQTLLNSGNAIQGVRQADQVPEAQALTPQQLARAAAVTAVDTGLNTVGAGAALAKPAANAGLRALGGSVVNAAKTGALANAGQSAADGMLINGRLPTTDELMASAAVGGVAGGAVRGLKAVPELPRAGEADMFRWADQYDPKLLAQASQRIKQQQETYGKLTESNGALLLEEARKAAQSNQSTNDDYGHPKRIIAGLHNLAESRGADDRLPYVYQETIDSLRAKQPVPKSHTDMLEANLGSRNKYLDRWLDNVKEGSVLNHLGQVGIQKGDAQIGGLRATPTGQILDKMSGYFGIGSLGSGLAAHMMGAGTLGKVGMGIGIGTNLLNAGVGLVDRALGQNDPVGRFMRRFEDPTAYSGPARQIAQTVSQGPGAPPTPPQGPGAPPQGPSGGGGMPPLVSPLAQRLAALKQAQAPANSNLIAGQLPPMASQKPLPNPLVLGRAQMKMAQDNGPLTQDNTRQYPRFGTQDNSPFVQDNAGPMVPEGIPMNPGVRFGGPPPEPMNFTTPQDRNLLNMGFDPTKPVNPKELAMVQAMIARATREGRPLAPMGPRGPEDMAAPTFGTRNNEVPLDYKGTGPLTEKLRRMHEGITEEPKPVKEPRAPRKSKEPKAEASVTPMEEAVKSRPKKAKEAPKKTSEPPRKPKAAPPEEAKDGFDAHGFRVNYPDNVRDKSRYQNGVMRRATPRKEVADALTREAPRSMKKAFKKLYHEWMKAKNPQRAESMLEDLITNDKVPLETQSKLWDIWNVNRDRLWRDWVEEDK